MSTTLTMGDMFACQECMAEIQVMQGCDCKKGCADLKCCGKSMKNITEPTVRNAGDTSIGDGMELQQE